MDDDYQGTNESEKDDSVTPTIYNRPRADELKHPDNPNNSCDNPNEMFVELGCNIGRENLKLIMKDEINSEDLDSGLLEYLRKVFNLRSSSSN